MVPVHYQYIILAVLSVQELWEADMASGQWFLLDPLQGG